ncbi:MAG: putative PurR-regulated permease PerM, partial [Planctomycetota bacterium]
MNVSNRTMVLLLGVIAAVLVGWVLQVGAAILQPIVIATLLASMLQPLVRALAKLRIPPAFTVMAITGLLFFGLIEMGLLFQTNARAFLGLDAESSPTPIQQQAEPRPQQEPGLQKPADQDEEVAGALLEGSQEEGLEDGGEEGEEQREVDQRTDLEISQDVAGDWSNITHKISIRLLESDLPGPVTTYLSKAIKDLELTPLAEGLAASGYSFVKALVLVLIYMVFIFSEQAVFRSKILAIADDRSEEAAEILDTIGRGIQRYLGVKTVVSFLTGSLC